MASLFGQPNTTLVGIGEMATSATPSWQIKTMALGSCVAVTLWDWYRCVAGMVHIALPDSQVDQARAQALPGYFADTGIAALLRMMVTRHMVEPSSKNLVVKLVGGARVSDPKGTFAIGERNIEAIKRILAARKLAIDWEDVGGTISRTVTMYTDDGRLVIATPSLPDRIL